MAEKRFKKGPHVDFTMTNMPMSVYEEFRKDASSNYGDCYWMAVKGNLDKAKMYDVLVLRDEALWIAIEKLTEEIALLQEQPQPEIESKDSEVEEEEERVGLGSLCPKKGD